MRARSGNHSSVLKDVFQANQCDRHTKSMKFGFFFSRQSYFRFHLKIPFIGLVANVKKECVKGEWVLTWKDELQVEGGGVKWYALRRRIPSAITQIKRLALPGIWSARLNSRRYMWAARAPRLKNPNRQHLRLLISPRGSRPHFTHPPVLHSVLLNNSSRFAGLCLAFSLLTMRAFEVNANIYSVRIVVHKEKE